MVYAMTSKGYAGSLDTVDFARFARFYGSPYAVRDEASWALSASPGVAFGVRLSAGAGFGHNVHDTSVDFSPTMTAVEPASGSQWFTVVARRDWQPGAVGDRTKFVLVPGTATQALAPGLNANPGVLDDQPLWLVRFTRGTTTPTAVVDLRVFVGAGGVSALTTGVLDYLTDLGTRVWIVDREYIRVLAGSGSRAWLVNMVSAPLDRRGWISGVPRTGADLWAGNNNGNMAVCGVTNAPAGTYLLSGRCEVSPQAATDVEQAFLTRYLANGVLVANREFGTTKGAGRYRSETAPSVPHYHAGGNLTVILQARCAVTCAVRRAEVTATYVGPAAG